MLSLLSVLALAGAVASQNVIQIAVGSSGSNPFIFTPPNVTASTGDVVMFTFSGLPGNHSVTQSSFTDPCDPLGNGFDSGIVEVLSSVADFPVWNLTITNTSTPIWFFCKQLIPQPHCDVGMVGAINAPSTGNTFDSYVTNAKNHRGNSGQSVGFLVGQGASASTVPGPLTASGESGINLPNPTAIAPSSISSSSTAAATSTSPSNAAMGTKVSKLVVAMAALFGVVLA